MKKLFTIVSMTLIIPALTSCGGGPKGDMPWIVDRFDDIKVIRYEVPGFDALPLEEKELIYYLSEAAKCGRDILFDQNCPVNLPVRRTRDGRYKVQPGEMVYTCFTSDFLVEEADAWRAEAWEMIRTRSDLRFFFITKRIDRLMQVLPPDWGEGYENLAVGCTVENQSMADYRLPLLLEAPLRHKLIICAPLLGPLDIARYLTSEIEEVSAGGESGNDARPCDFDWVLSIRRQCLDADIPFCYHQTGARLVKDGRLYRIRRRFQHAQARKAGIDYKVWR